jgi:hypothetical protein
VSKRRNRKRSKYLQQLEALQNQQHNEMLQLQSAKNDTPKKAALEENQADEDVNDESIDDTDDDYTDEKVLSRAQDNIRDWYDYSSESIQTFKDDMTFALGDQWSTFARAEISDLRKTGLVFNKVYDYIRRVIGQQRKNTVAPVVRPKDFAASDKDISLRAGLLRSIYQDSDGKTVEQMAATSSLMGGFGAGVVEIDYAGPKTRKQIVKWRAFPDPLLAFFDPKATHPTKRDGEFAGYYELTSKKALLKEHPTANTAELPGLLATGDYFSWSAPGDLMAIVWYFEKRHIPTELYTLTDGFQTVDVYKEEYEEDERYQLLEIESKRKTKRVEVWGYKMTGHEILEKSRFPVPMLPVVRCVGDAHHIDGKEVTYSLVHHARDPQRFFNYIMSEVADDIKKGRKEQWLGTPENIPNSLKRIWRNPELREGLLLAQRDSTGALPQKVPADEIRRSLLEIIPNADANIQAALGMFDANRGEETNAVSGVAYREQAMLGAATTAVYFDNLNKFTQQLAAITVALMPYVYDSERYVGVVGENGKHETKLINAYPGDVLEDVGEFDVVIELTPSLEFEKESALKLLIEIAQLPQPVMATYGDLIMKLVPAENVAQLVKRAQMNMDPRVLAMEKGEPPPPPQPDPQAQLIQMQMQVEGKKLQLEEQKMMGDQQELMMNAKLKQTQFSLDEQKLMQQAMMQQAKFEETQVKAHAEMQKAYLSQQEKVLSLLGQLAKPIAASQGIRPGG